QGPIEMLFGKDRGAGGDFTGKTGATTTSTAAAPAAATATTVTRIAASDRVKRALKFFEYDASLSEAVEPAFKLPPGVSEEIKKLNTIARDFVSSEKQRGDEFLSKISDVVNSLREITNAKTFDELIASLKAAEARGIKLTVSEVQTASKKIRDELEKQRKEDPEKFKQAVMTMRQKSPDIKEADDVDAAMLFMFGVTKSNVQQQLIKMQESLLGRVRSVMNLPIDEEVRKELQQSGIGEEYLRFIDGFERTLTTGEKETESLRKSFKSAKTRV
ncbi:hypothetical protein EBZ37_11375, partial [bacterium]|nr:hypothetical protein [bacterium]